MTSTNAGSFFGIGIAPNILDALERLKFKVPTPIQGVESATAAQMDATARQPDMDMAAGIYSDGRTKYKTLVLHYENQSIKLEMALRRGLRYAIADAKREAHGLGATVRAAMERLIDQTAPRLAVMSSDSDRRRLISAELRRLRWMIKTDLPRALRRLRQAGAKKDAA